MCRLQDEDLQESLCAFVVVRGVRHDRTRRLYRTCITDTVPVPLGESCQQNSTVNGVTVYRLDPYVYGRVQPYLRLYGKVTCDTRLCQVTA